MGRSYGLIRAAGFLFLFACGCHAGEMARGADIGWLPQMERGGYVFRDHAGNKADCLDILRAHGIDTVRLRVWVNPSDDPRSGHCSPEEVTRLAERAHRKGFRIMINFHYSDTWADPAHQTKPAAWADHDLGELKGDVYDHTFEVLSALKKRGVVPEWVQVGNEIRDGMLWPEGRMSASPENLADLINAGYRAVKKVDSSIKVVVHLDRGNDAELSRWFFDSLKTHGARYDVIGLSYYPYWLENQKDYRMTINDLGENLIDLAALYDKEVMLVEVGGPSDQPEDTKAMLSAVIEKVQAVPKGRGLGVIYWEPQGARSWSGYPLSCWGNDGTATDALDAFLVEKENPRHK
ncbi:MAG: glycosyl hydrolase 53 family protein [Pontiellaceae bacterium]|nr:glycosyl hydrolase 53 family protein [Pontiellaceae bacterium]MBN2786422.1 glycosyl hydrolase 53 family protein [Pontiellaceae bacterium]